MENDPERHRRHPDGRSRGLRHRIPYRLLGRRSVSTKRLVVSSKVWLPAIPTSNCDVVVTFPASTDDATLMWLLARLKARAPTLSVHVRHHSNSGIYGFYLTATYENLLRGAEELGIRKLLKTDYGGGMKEFVFEDQDCFAGIEEEKVFLTSQERQSIVLHFLNDLRATGEDELKSIRFLEGQPIVPLLLSKNVISQVFPLHCSSDLTHLRQRWVQAFLSCQPLDLVRQYFGVKIGLYFAYLGHYTTWLILPAVVGLLVFLLQDYDQLTEDVSFVGFALLNVLWATLYLKHWERKGAELAYRWGTLDKKDELLSDPRPLFKGTLEKSPVTGHLEPCYPAWKRSVFRYFVSGPIIGVFLIIVFIIMLLIFELQEWVNDVIREERVPYFISFGPKVLLALSISVLDELYKRVAIWLTFQENYRLEETHETNLVIKLVLFQFVNSFLSLFYTAFYLGDMDRLRDILATLLITRQVLGNLKEALLPYVIWKVRLFNVGYRIATRMSPASVEKAVRRMTKRSCRASHHQPGVGEGDRADSDGDSTVTEEEDEGGVPTLTQAEVESAMKKYESTYEDYLEMTIQFGYVTLFSSAFPLAAFCALVNNVIEIRSDAFKLCLTHQRPFGESVENIGIWQDVLFVMSMIAVIVNCALVGKSGLMERLLPGLSDMQTFFFIIIIEHVLLAGKFVLFSSIPNLPQAVATEMAKWEYQRREAVKRLESQLTSGLGSILGSPGSPEVRRRRFGENAESGQDQAAKDQDTSTDHSRSSAEGASVRSSPSPPRQLSLSPSHKLSEGGATSAVLAEPPSSSHHRSALPPSGAATNPWGDPELKRRPRVPVRSAPEGERPDVRSDLRPIFRRSGRQEFRHRSEPVRSEIMAAISQTSSQRKGENLGFGQEDSKRDEKSILENVALKYVPKESKGRLTYGEEGRRKLWLSRRRSAEGGVSPFTSRQSAAMEMAGVSPRCIQRIQNLKESLPPLGHTLLPGRDNCLGNVGPDKQPARTTKTGPLILSVTPEVLLRKNEPDVELECQSVASSGACRVVPEKAEAESCDGAAGRMRRDDSAESESGQADLTDHSTVSASQRDKARPPSQTATAMNSEVDDGGHCSPSPRSDADSTPESSSLWNRS